MKNKDKTLEVPLPGIFTGEELMTAFRNAASFNEDANTRWEFSRERYTPGCYVGGHHYYLVKARPVFRSVPGRFALRRRQETWSLRKSAWTDSECTIYLSQWGHDLDVCVEDMTLNAYLTARFEGHDNHDYIQTTDLDHPVMRRYRAGFERIRANFLTNLILHAQEHVKDQVERGRDASRWASELIGVADEAA